MKRKDTFTFRDEQIFREYLPLVKSIVGWIQRRLPACVDRNDLIAAGMSGLWSAIKKPNLDGEHFEGYARTRIRGSILDEMRAQDWLPRRTRNKGLELPSIILGCDEFTLNSVENGRTPENERADSLLVQKEMRIVLERTLALLPRKERYILTERFLKGVKFKDMAIVLGISEARVSQIAKKGLEILRMREELQEYLLGGRGIGNVRIDMRDISLK